MNVTKEQLEHFYIEKNLSTIKCAELLGYSSNSGIHNLLRKFGIPTRPKGRHDHRFHGITKDRLRELYVDQKLSVRECAKALGLPSHGAITERIKEFGIKARRGKFQPGNSVNAGRTGEKAGGWKGGKKKILCAECGERLERFPVLISGNNFCNQVCFGRWISKNNILSQNPNWKGGTSFEPYPITWSFRLREKVRNRDERKCRICGKDEGRRRHAVHHIDYDKNNLDPENLVTLCLICHCKTNSNREQWQSFFNEQKNIPLTGTND